MKSVIIAVLAAALLACSCRSQEQAMVHESDSWSFQPKPLDDEWSKWLVGDWEGSAESDAGTAQLRTKIEFGMNGQFLIMKGESEITELSDEQRRYLRDTLSASDEEIERYRSSIFKGVQIHTIDPKTGDVIGYLFDSMRCIAEGRGRRQGNEETIEWEWSANAQGATSVGIIERIDDDKFALHHKYILPDGSEMEDEVEMTRRKMTTKK